MSIQSSFPVLTRRMLKAVRTGLAQQIRAARLSLRLSACAPIPSGRSAEKRAAWLSRQAALRVALSHNARAAHLCAVFAAGKPYAAAELRAEPLTEGEAAYLARYMVRVLGYVRAGYQPIDDAALVAWIRTPATAEMLERQQRAREAHFQARLADAAQAQHQREHARRVEDVYAEEAEKRAFARDEAAA